jgi:formylglycine-generating enzyme required for sulfatase activity
VSGGPVFTDVPGTGDEPGFRLAVTPTTVGQYWAYLSDRGLDTAPEPELHAFPAAPGTGLHATAAGVEFDSELSDLPVTGVTWAGAADYCAWLGAGAGLVCRLPSVREWERAAGGPDGSPWALGDEFDRPEYAPASAAGPRPVSARANGFGLRGMTGNVFEWCADELRAPDGTALGSRAIKGGAYTMRNPESFLTTTTFSADERTSVPYIGFRALVDLPATRGGG